MLSPNKYQIGSKASSTSPPTKLLINHGKPNFTIPRTKNYQKYHISVDETDKNEVAKIILKKPSVKNTNTIVNNGFNKTENIEFFQKHQRIAKKLSIGGNDYNNDVNQQNHFDHANCEFLQQHKKIVNNSNNSNGTLNLKNNFPPLLNGESPVCFKPYQSKTNGTLIVHTDLKVNDSAVINKPQKPEIKQKPLNTPPISIMQSKVSAASGLVDIESGPNFEQKTVVSFSRELAQPNKYLDTVKVVEENEGSNENLMGMAQLKFDIKEDGKEDLIVTPVIL